MKFGPVGAELSQGGQTDMKLIVAFRNSANALTNHDQICDVVTVKFSHLSKNVNSETGRSNIMRCSIRM
jgi:hypothetical protein